MTTARSNSAQRFYRSRSYGRRILIPALFFVILGAGCGAAETWELSESRSGESAAIAASVLETGAPIRLIAPDDDPIGGLGHAVDWHSDLVVVDYVAANVKVFDEQGRFRLAIGRPGDGPGEFRMPESATVDANGQLLVRDSYKVTTFDRTGEPVALLTFPGYGGHGVATVFQEDDVLLATQLAAEDGVVYGPMVHVFNRSGQVVRSLGTVPRPHDPLEEILLVGTAAVSRDGTVAWGVQSRPDLQLSFDWGQTIHSVDIKSIPRPDWKKIAKRVWRDSREDPDAWLDDYVSQYPLLNDIGFVRRQPVLKFFRGVDGPDRFVYVMVDQASGRQASTGGTRHNVHWDKDESGHGWSVWMDETGMAFAQRVVLNQVREGN